MLPDGSIKQYRARFIADNLFHKVDGYGYKYKLLKVIIDNHTTVIQKRKESEFIQSKNVTQRHRQNTKEWNLKVH